MLKRGEELVVSITDSAFEGKSIARIDDLVVFIEGGVPGDVAKIQILKSKKNYAEAKVVSIESPSSLRVEPHCKYFGVCGGCKWQNVDYAAQLRFKQQHVVDSFERIGGFSGIHVLPIIGSEEIFYYRGKMEYSFSDQQWLTTLPPKVNEDTLSQASSLGSQITSSIYLGLHVPQRYDKVLDLEECHLQSEVSNRILNFTRDFAKRNNLTVYNSDAETGYLRFLVIRESKKLRGYMVNLVSFTDQPEIMQKYTDLLLQECPDVTTIVNTINSKRAQIAFGEVEKIYFGPGVIHERLGKNDFVVSASSFFQTNVFQAEKLYQVAKEFGELQPTDVVYDLYSGTGSIALFVADAVKEVIGIESVESAVRDAEKNARKNKILNCTFHLGDLKDRLTKDTEWMTTHPKPDVLIIDPPRSGMHPKVIEEIIEMGTRRIVYVSCNPATQARDVQLLCKEKYQLVKLQPVDMFPHTYHIENVALLTRR